MVRICVRWKRCDSIQQGQIKYQEKTVDIPFLSKNYLMIVFEAETQ